MAPPQRKNALAICSVTGRRVFGFRDLARHPHAEKVRFAVRAPQDAVHSHAFVIEALPALPDAVAAQARGGRLLAARV